MLKWLNGNANNSTSTHSLPRSTDGGDDDGDAGKLTMSIPGSFDNDNQDGGESSTSTTRGNSYDRKMTMKNKDMFKSPNASHPASPASPSTPSLTFTVPSLPTTIPDMQVDGHTIPPSGNGQYIGEHQQTPPSTSSMPEFKAPSISLSTPVASASSSTNRSKPRPKPSHRAFPPEPVSLLHTSSNGRVTLSSTSSSSSSIQPSSQNNKSLLGSSLGLPAGTSLKPRKQRFVALEPGYSPLDWARLNREGDDYELRCGYDTPQKFTIQEVSEHATPNDAWSIFNGKVYNITPYLHYHPGGVKELMRAAGKDGTDLFMEYHAWVNAELMLEGCLIGFLVR